MSRIEGAHGVYSETYREVNWRSEYEPRVGSETIEKDRLDFVKTYLGMQGENEEEEARIEPKKVKIVEKEPEAEFRGSLVKGPTEVRGVDKKTNNDG